MDKPMELIHFSIFLSISIIIKHWNKQSWTLLITAHQLITMDVQKDLYMYKSTENIEKGVNTKQPSLYNAFCYRKFLILGACIRDFTEKMIANVKQ